MTRMVCGILLAAVYSFLCGCAAKPAPIAKPAKEIKMQEKLPDRAVLRGLQFQESDKYPVYFALGSAELTDKAEDRLKELVEIIQVAPPVSIVVDGHACPIGGEAYNLSLSDKRAKTVQGYLQESGIDVPIIARGYGESRPQEKEVGNYHYNRRVDVFLLEDF